ncbi:hypothetical protein CAPTEDRAFT_106538 [Capitella teleta]|uniref:Chitin-binding type-2 domain-containing protein n=1 Tax=Capitella teleta TaxID=283909 RepID=R7TR16_CAPTE|nr:hypothetical protein CAPTEDRAFT_106538 [Capitella teleta]|eukprot:ELT96104.1 hypothetical protein CAPTEDRAFT_106538 [Capitella teleta]
MTLDTITRDLTSAIPDPSTSAPKFTCPKYNATHWENRRYVYPGDCTKYYACYECMSDIFKCPWAFEYHSILQECVDPMYSDCEEFTCPKYNATHCENRRYVYPGDCTKYYACYECMSDIFKCPWAFEYHSILQECVDPMYSDCEGYTSAPPEFTCPKYNATHCENRRYVYPGDCTKYYACYECMSDIFKCPWAFEYHSILQECVDPMYSDCEELTSAIPDPSTSAPEFTCPKYNATHCENRRYVYPGDCTKYYACYECMSDIFKCPWAFEYHSILQECVDPMYSDCEELTSAIPDPSTSAPEFTCPKYNATHCENRRYVYPGDCTKYYACYECMSDIFKCPWAFEYHSNLQECVDPIYSDCEGELK